MTREPRTKAHRVCSSGHTRLRTPYAPTPARCLRARQELLESSKRNWPIQRDLDRYAHFSGGAKPPELKYLQFSDTLLIWLSAEHSGLFESPGQLVRTVCYAASLTLAAFIGAGVPLRGSIGFGPAFISFDPLFFTGWELYQTMKLERTQAWAGATLHETAAAALSEPHEAEPFSVDYVVPMSDPSEAAPSLAVDWVTPLCAERPLTPPWERMFRSTPSDARLDRKRDETRKFFETMVALHRPFPLRMAEDTILGMRSRVAAILDAL